MDEAARGWGKRIRRSVKSWYACQAADVVFLSPGKCGRTWVRAMLSHAYHLSYGTPVNELVSRYRFHRLDARVPRFFFSHVVREPFLVRRRLTSRGLRGKTVVCLVRDPRDVVVSYYHHRVHRSKQASLAGQPGGDAALLAECALGTVAHLAERMNRLRALAETHERGHLFRYEDFHADPVGQLARLLRVIGNDDVPEAHIEAAVAFSAFDKLKQREAAGFYRSDNLRPGDVADPKSFKVRRGKVGGYRDVFTKAQIRELDQRIDATLSLGLGYRSDERRPASPALMSA
jgi:hypothetical protein